MPCFRCNVGLQYILDKVNKKNARQATMSEIKDETIPEEVTGGNSEESVKYPYGETGPLGTGPLDYPYKK